MNLRLTHETGKDRSVSKWGVLFVGCHGATASTFIAAVLSPTSNNNALSLGTYFSHTNLMPPIDVGDFVFGGWDHRFNDLSEAVRVNGVFAGKCDVSFHQMPSILGPSDFPVRIENQPQSHESLESAVTAVQADIRQFREVTGVNEIIVINTSSPMHCNADNGPNWSSTIAYCKAAVLSFCHWVEFTPSDSITAEVIACARAAECYVAGRDGSTGQTILKLAVRDFLTKRGFRLDSWYSTNLIGNHDGLVLSLPEYRVTKIADKTDVLKQHLQNETLHKVEIHYSPPSGDNKESWDLVHFTGWMNQPMSMRINWQGKDSYLAGSLLLDTIYGIVHARKIKKEAGLLSELGLFFKHPIGHSDYDFESLHKLLISFLTL